MFHECIYSQQGKCTKMISRRVFLFATLTLAAIGYAQASITLEATVIFSYKDGDILDINIFLQCVPKMASTFVLYRETKNCHVYPDQCTELARNETIPENKMITITQPLRKPIIAIYIQLYNKNEEQLTNKTTILKGIGDYYAHNNRFHDRCLTNKQYQNDSKCQIDVNFGNQCEVSERAVKIDCTQHEGRLICEVGDDELPEDTVHQWYQEYENGSFIQPIPQLKGKKTEFKMKLQKFDNNTKIYGIMKSTSSQKKFYSQTFKISLPNDGFKDYKIENKLQYAENETITFFCSNNTDTHVGWIDPTAHTITLNNKTSYTGRLSKERNSGMFCCISYNVNQILNLTAVVTRSVDKITLIIMKPVNQNNVKVSDAKSDNSMIIIISSTSSAVVAVVLISIFAIKTSCWKKNGQSQRPRPPMPLPPKQPAPYTPFYENVALRGDCVLQAQDEPHYEEVIYH